MSRTFPLKLYCNPDVWFNYRTETSAQGTPKSAGEVQIRKQGIYGTVFQARTYRPDGNGLFTTSLHKHIKDAIKELAEDFECHNPNGNILFV